MLFFFKVQEQSKDIKLCLGFHSLFYPFNLFHLLSIYSTLALHQKRALNNIRMAKQVYLPIKSCLLKQIAALVYKNIHRKVDLKVQSYLNALEGLLKQKVLVPAFRDSDSGISQRSLTDPEKFHFL